MAMLVYGYGAIALCLLTVALHDIGVWLDRYAPRAYYVTITVPIDSATGEGE